MEKIVNFRDRQELQAADFANVQIWTRASIDHIVQDVIEPGRAYKGLTVDKVSATELQVSTGRLYGTAGAIFAKEAAEVIDLFSVLPSTNTKKVAVVAWGSTVDTDVQPRDFLIDASTMQAEPNNVSMQNSRVCLVGTVAGVENPSPSLPTISADNLLIAVVVLDRNGIVSIQQWDENKVENLRNVAAIVDDLTTWRGVVGQQLDTLRTDLSGLANTMVRAFAEVATTLGDLTKAIKEVRDQLNRPTNYLTFTDNHFLDESDSDDTRAGWDCIVNEGIRLPHAASDTLAVNLLSPTDVRAAVSDNIMLPAYSSIPRITTGFADGSIRMSLYTYNTVVYNRWLMSRLRWRYGAWFWPGTSYLYWKTALWNSVYYAFRWYSEVWPLGVGPYANEVWHYYNRYPYWWFDWYGRPYWDYRVVQHNVSGQIVGQTWLNAQDGWLTGIAPHLSSLAPSGDIHIMICETTAGQPDVSKCLMKTTVSVPGLSWGYKVPINLPPTFLSAGQRYAILFQSAGDHWFGTTTMANAVLQGTMFVGTDGAYFQGILERDLCIDFYYAKWGYSQYHIDLQPLSLAGGVHNIDVTQHGNVPSATELHYEVQVNGVWTPLTKDGEASLSTLPQLLPFRAVFTGTHDLMPAVGVGANSQVIVSRSKTAGTHCSKPRQLGSNSSSVKITAKLENFNENDHDFVVKLYTGNTYATEETADVVSDFTLPDGSIMRTLTFNIAAAAKYFIKSQMSVASIDQPFHVAEMVEYANT